jgi:hypothetical protein
MPVSGPPKHATHAKVELCNTEQRVRAAVNRSAYTGASSGVRCLPGVAFSRSLAPSPAYRASHLSGGSFLKPTGKADWSPALRPLARRVLPIVLFVWLPCSGISHRSEGRRCPLLNIRDYSPVRRLPYGPNPHFTVWRPLPYLLASNDGFRCISGFTHGEMGRSLSRMPFICRAQQHTEKVRHRHVRHVVAREAGIS